MAGGAYFDVASAAPTHPAARQALLAAIEEGWADPDKLYTQARRARQLLDAARASLRKAIEMENRHGKNSWPVISPDRGVTAYEFVHQILRRHIAAVTGEPVEEAIRIRTGEVGEEVLQAHSAEEVHAPG